MTKLARGDLKTALDQLYIEFNAPDSAADPVHIVRRFEKRDDREVVGFFAASLAFGRVASVLQSIERLLAVVGDRPAEYVRRFDPRKERRAYAALVHRWIGGRDLLALVWIVRQMLDLSGSIESFFLEGHDDSAPDVMNALDSFSARALAFDVSAVYGVTDARRRGGGPDDEPHLRMGGRFPASSEGRPRAGVGYFFPRPSAGSACKRLNLFLRWMARRDGVDLGVWTRLRPAQLVVPLDTHVIRVGRCLRLTEYTSPGWRMARDITNSLRRLDPEDPVKYDFSLCHLGMMNACGFSHARADAQCPLRGVCRPRVRKRRLSRRSSDRR